MNESETMHFEHAIERIKDNSTGLTSMAPLQGSVVSPSMFPDNLMESA